MIGAEAAAAETGEQDEEAIARALVVEAWRDGLRQDSRMSVVEWIEANRVLSSVSGPSPGRYRFRTTPYLREIAEVLSPACPIQDVCMRKGAQLGVSEFAASILGYLIDQVPGPIIYFMPTVDLLKAFVHQRFQPMVDGSPVLAARVGEEKARGGRPTDSVRMKRFPGGMLALLTASSPASLRSFSARFIFEDEVDGAPLQLTDEGDPVELVERAARAFGRRRKIFRFSTPTVVGRSRISKSYDASDQRSFLLPCPKCGGQQRLYWEDTKTGKRGVQWEPKERPVEVWYECALCSARIDEGQKDWMLQQGIWRPKFPELSDERRGYEISALYSPRDMYSWTDAVKAFVKAKDQPEKLRVFINQTLGEAWEVRGDAPPWEELYRRRENYPLNTVPKGAYVLTCGVDIQPNRIEASVWAWGPRLQSWLVCHEVFNCDDRGDVISSDRPWDALDELILRTFPNADGVEIPIKLAAVDTAFATNRAYDYCRFRRREHAYAVRGMDSLNVPIGLPTYQDVSFRGRKMRRGVQLWGVGVSVLKRELYGFLRAKPPLEAGDKMPYGYCHFPDGMGPEYFKQLTAEQIEQKPDKRGFMQHEWILVHQRNEALDCRNYARAAAHILGVDRWSDADWARVAGGYRTSAAPPSRTEEGRGGYWDRFRSSRGEE